MGDKTASGREGTLPVPKGTGIKDAEVNFMADYVVHRTIVREDLDAGRSAELRRLGVATVSEAQARRGLLDPAIRPLKTGLAVAGPAVTVEMPAGDNLMLHAAIELLEAGDMLVVTTWPPSLHGVFGDLLAEACHWRGVAGVVLDAGVRDVAAIRSLGLPVWARAIYAGGAQKHEGGRVNVPVTAGGAAVAPGDFVLADDDGVVCVPRRDVDTVIRRGEERAAREQQTRTRLRAGALSLDLSNLRPVLEQAGVRYVEAPYGG
jgi:4-hydroxy-4-methyl-2-oxoglutarate aldolase